MIAYLEGKVLSIDEQALVLLVGGVGYELSCSRNTLEEFSLGEKAQLFVHTHVREEALQLYGFKSSLEKQIFLSLIKVNGVGPKSAVQILSGARPEMLFGWIEDSDVKALSKLPKIGKKTAEQIILSLKGKLVIAEEGQATSAFKERPQIISALVNLGFRLNDVEKVVDQMDPTIDLDQAIRSGLQALTN
jgi:Holliday junction DNA helicase RuvA